MKEIKSIHDIKNGWLVVTRGGLMFLRVGDTLIDEHRSWILCSGYRFVEGILTNPNQPKKFSGEFDIVEIWKPKYKGASLSFSLDDRELVWKEQEQKYYIKHKWLEDENFGFVNLSRENNLSGLNSQIEDEEFKTQFAASEIEELKEKYNTTLEDFEIIPVEEI